MKTVDFDYELPPDLIAQHPSPVRTDARMMVVRRCDSTIEHRVIRELPAILRPGDLLVANDTRVIPARLCGVKEQTGGHAEVFLLEDVGSGKWSALCRASGKVRTGLVFNLAGGRVTATVVEIRGGGEVVVDIRSDAPILKVLEEAGETPLPPYIKRPAGPEPYDRTRYQTVYSRTPGAVAAPTAGLHFTQELLGQLAGCGIPLATVTLHVGAGTFKPVKSVNVEDHAMDTERFSVPGETAEKVCVTHQSGGRVVAVGTTTVRALESAALRSGQVEQCEGRTDLFIRESFRFRAVDAILTNFHLPQSTLLMMICAFAGRDLILRAYREAVAARYRFYSYGDCMLVE